MKMCWNQSLNKLLALKKYFWLFLISLHLLTTWVWGATYFVNSGGSDTSPYDTESKAATQVETIFDLDLNPGDSVEMTSNITEADGIVAIDANDSGDSNSQVTFNLNGYTLTGRITSSDLGYFTIRKGTIKGAAGYGIWFTGTFGSEQPGIIIEDMTIDSAAQSGISVKFKVAPIIRRITINNCGTEGANNHDGILIGSNTSDFLLQDVTVTGQKSKDGSAFDFSNAGTDGNAETTSGIIERCYAYDNSVSNGVLKFSDPTDKLNTDPDAINITVRYSKLIDDDQLIKLNGYGISYFYNNTFVAKAKGSAAMITLVDDHTQTVIFKNNILEGTANYGLRVEDSNEGTLIATHNIYSTGIGTGLDINSLDYDGKTWAEWVNAKYDATGSIVADPLLNADYFPLPGSPVENAGIAIAGITTDFANNTVSNPPEIGAYEIQQLWAPKSLKVSTSDPPEISAY